MAPAFGFIGFGEVAAAFSEAMLGHGARVYGTVRGRMSLDGVPRVSLEEVVEKSDIVLSTAKTQVARSLAEQVADLLRADQIYVDLNSTSPAVKVGIGEVIARSAGDFVEGAVLGAVGATGARTRVLVAGERSEEVAELLNDHGLNVTAYSKDIGKASTFKMLRSVFSKGLECLIIELLIAGKRGGIEQDLWSDVTSFMASKPFDVIADNWTRTHGVAYERRYHEMLQVIETLRELEVSPIMTEATTALFERSVSLDLASRLEGATDVRNAVIEALEQADRPAG